MMATERQDREKQTGPGEPASELQQGEAVVEVETEPAPIETKKSGGGMTDRQWKIRRAAYRWALLLLILGLAVTGYLALTFFKARNGVETTSAGEHVNAGHRAELKVLYWQDPMNPAYRSDKPGKAPDGMDLAPVYETGAGQAAMNMPEGAFKISPEKQQLIGVQYGEAADQPVFKTLRTVGRLVYDETKIVRIHPKIEGWIDQVYIDFTGKLVKKGQPLISLYSPELLQTQQEFLLARRGRDELAESPFREAVAGSESLYQAARKRLELWDITEEQIKELEKHGQPHKTLTLYAPADGFVLARNAFPKQRVTPETELYSIADLSTIWVMADVYEYEAPEIKIGQSVKITLAYFPGRVYRGQVTYIYPQLDSTTRTLKARIEVPNPDFALKPDMYANAELKIDYGRRLVVPQEAVLDSGSEQLLFIAHDGGYFEPRQVQLGPKVDNNFIVLGGLKAGERLVTSANFLVDSESKLRSAAGGMGMPGMSHGGGAPASDKLTPQADHSQHQPSGQPMPKTEPEDHSRHQARPEPKILYWYDPMNPAHKSDQPGKAPDGMDLVPKYANGKKER